MAIRIFGVFVLKSSECEDSGSFLPVTLKRKGSMLRSRFKPASDVHRFIRVLVCAMRSTVFI